MHPDLEQAIAFHESIVAEGGKALVGYDTAKALANVVLMSEIPTLVRQEGTAPGQRRQPAVARRPRRRQDVLRRHPRGHQQREVRAHSRARGPAADRSGRLPDDQPGHRRADDRIRSARRGGSHPARRNQPHPAQVAERVPRSAAGSDGHRRQDHVRAARVQLRDRDDEPGRARAGHVPALGSGHRSVRDHGEHRLPAARGGSQAGALRLQEACASTS